MKNQVLALVAGILFTSVAFGQADSTAVEGADSLDKTPKHWETEAIFGLTGSQSSFVNWNAGGRNNVTIIGSIVASATYKKDKFQWENDLNTALGGTQFIGVGNGDQILQKTDDKIELGTKVGYNLFDHTFITLMNNFRTQYLDGFKYPNDSVVVSRFMAPGYYNFGLGLDYSPSEHFSLFFSPIAGKLTFVRDQNLANAGAFGVDPAVYDLTTGELISKGKNLRKEFGAYLKMKINRDLAKNISVIATTELFSNYLNHPENIDVNADILFNFKVNSWFSASVNWTVKYDHDILIEDANGNIGPRLQFKSVLGIGISYKLHNHDEK